jgi:hypothetical protein
VGFQPKAFLRLPGGATAKDVMAQVVPSIARDPTARSSSTRVQATRSSNPTGTAEKMRETLPENASVTVAACAAPVVIRAQVAPARLSRGTIPQLRHPFACHQTG